MTKYLFEVGEFRFNCHILNFKSVSFCQNILRFVATAGINGKILSKKRGTYTANSISYT